MAKAESMQVFLSPIRRVLHQQITEREIIDISLKKCSDCIFRGIDDRLFVHIETGVNQRGDTTQIEIFFNNSIIAWIHFFAN